MRPLTITLPADLAIALRRFMHDQLEPWTEETAIEAALREFMIAHGYLEVEEMDEETPTEGEA